MITLSPQAKRSTRIIKPWWSRSYLDPCHPSLYNLVSESKRVYKYSSNLSVTFRFFIHALINPRWDLVQTVVRAASDVVRRAGGCPPSVLSLYSHGSPQTDLVQKLGFEIM